MTAKSFKIRLTLLSIPFLLWTLLTISYLVVILLLSFKKTSETQSHHSPPPPPPPPKQVEKFTPPAGVNVIDKGKLLITLDIPDNLTLKDLKSLYADGFPLTIKTSTGEFYLFNPVTGETQPLNSKNFVGYPIANQSLLSSIQKHFGLDVQEIFLSLPSEVVSKIVKRIEQILLNTSAEKVIKASVKLRIKNGRVSLYLKSITYKTNSGEVKTWMRNY